MTNAPTPTNPPPAATWRRHLTPSVLVLLAANLYPLFGVLFLGWDVLPLLVIFWAENVVIGAENVVRMITARPRSVAAWFGKVTLVPFFIVHYGLFATAHGAIILELFGHIKGATGKSFFGMYVTAWQYMRDHGLVLAVATLTLSHIFSLATNYFASGKFRDADPQFLMFTPYGRVVVLHVVILIGGFLAMQLGSPTIALVLLVLLKMVLDAAGHRWEHGLRGVVKQGGTAERR